MKIILYVMDSLRVDHCSCYGYKRQTTPNLDKLSLDGILFANAFSQSTWTTPSGATLLSGLYPLSHGARRRMNDYFPLNVVRLPEILKSQGIKKTAAISSIGHISSSLGFGKGFDIFQELYKNPSLIKRRELKNLNTTSEQQTVARVFAEDVNKEAFRFLETAYKNSFFLFMWTIDPHYPFQLHKDICRFDDSDYDGIVDGTLDSIYRVGRKGTPKDYKHIIDLYDHNVAYNDMCLGNLIDKLKNFGIYNDAMIIVTADHGENLGDFRRSNTIFGKTPFGHPYIPYDDLLHVPLIVKLPGQRAKGKRIDNLVELVDIMPTILSYFGIKHQNIQGKNLLLTLDGKNIHNYVFSDTAIISGDTERTYFSIRDAVWKYIMVLEKRHKKSLSPKILLKKIIHRFLPSSMLYCLKTDPGERVNLARKEVSKVISLQNELNKWIDANKENAVLFSDGIKFDEDEEDAIKKHLEDLGYID